MITSEQALSKQQQQSSVTIRTGLPHSEEHVHFLITWPTSEYWMHLSLLHFTNSASFLLLWTPHNLRTRSLHIFTGMQRCQNGQDMFFCEGSMVCIPGASICDGLDDCFDGASDELQCEMPNITGRLSRKTRKIVSWTQHSDCWHFSWSVLIVVWYVNGFDDDWELI